MPRDFATTKGLGLRKDIEDPRDYRLTVVRAPVSTAFSDYEGEMSPVKDQGGRGSCVAFGTVAVKEWQERAQRRTRRFYDFSEEWVYEQIRLPGGGAYPREAMKLLANVGVPREHLLPYRERPDEDTASDFTPTPRQLANARFYTARDYVRLTSIEQMEASLAANGPFTIGVSWRSGWFQPSGKEHKGYPVLEPGQGTEVGGHLIVGCGHEHGIGLAKIRNSWGDEWAKGGYCYLSYEAIAENLLDAWATFDVVKASSQGLIVEMPEVAEEAA